MGRSARVRRFRNHDEGAPDASLLGIGDSRLLVYFLSALWSCSASSFVGSML